MQKEISPKVMVGAAVALVAVIGVLFWVFNQRSGGAGTLEGQTPPGPPSDFTQRMSGARTGPGAAPGGAPTGAPGQ